MAAPSGNIEEALRKLRVAMAGEVRDDRLTRALYATDASIYQIVPDGVVLPKSVADVVAAVRICGVHGVPLTARGAGTGLTGGAVNRGIQLDCSRHLNRILSIDADAGIARVEPGVVLDELNAAVVRHRLHFAPDVATSSRATVGGMIGNNSCGAHSIVMGRTVDHVLSVDVVLSDGSVHTWGRDGHARHAGGAGPAKEARGPLTGVRGSDGARDSATPTGDSLARRCDETLRRIACDHADEIAARFPKVSRRNGGYALDRLRIDGGRINTETILCGSEGTLGIIVGATLKLVPLPKHKGLVVVHFEALQTALSSVPATLKHNPAAVELVDNFILSATKDNPAMARRRWFLEGEPAAILIVEFYEEDAARLKRRLDELVADMRGQRIGYAWPIVTDAARQADVWEVRKAGTGLLMSRPGDRQPHDFVDDTAVDPGRLDEYFRRFQELLREEGAQQAGFYGHASVGCVHVRPVLNLKQRDDIARLRRIAQRVAALAHEFGGTMTGEHGDGLVRSEFLPTMYGPKIMAAFGEIKDTFDPRRILNPNKIVDALPMDQNLRYGAGYATQQPPTLLDFDRFGGMAGLAEMCSGIGQCRQRLVGTMCPSYMATGDETHSTRARANALRMALSHRGLLDGLADPVLDEVFDLCLSCKACKTECPTGTDVAKLKAEWLSQRNQRLGVPRRSRLIARSVELAPWGSRLAPLSNWFMQSRVARVMLEHWYGLDRRMPPPRFAKTTFRQWFERRERGDGQPVADALGSSAQGNTRGIRAPDSFGPVVYFVDTWTNYYTPQVGIAAVKVLEALGYEVIVPATVCCGRPLISKGMLSDAQRLAERNVAVLAPYAERGVPIVGTEPSCVSAMLDEWPQLVRTPQARVIAERAQTVEAVVAAALAANPAALRFKHGRRPVLYHGHCHQKALLGTGDALHVLTACTGGAATEIGSGCCGMAGSFGHEVEHYDVAQAVGEQRLFPAIRERGEAQIAVSGFSCRHHIEHHTGATARHLIEYVADALDRG